MAPAPRRSRRFKMKNRRPKDPPKPGIREAHHHSSYHKAELEKSQLCGCFYCKQTFPPAEIKNWIDRLGAKGQTALCPRCGIDSVIGDAAGYPLTPDFLKDMSDYWFSP